MVNIIPGPDVRVFPMQVVERGNFPRSAIAPVVVDEYVIRNFYPLNVSPDCRLKDKDEVLLTVGPERLPNTDFRPYTVFVEGDIDGGPLAPPFRTARVNSEVCHFCTAGGGYNPDSNYRPCMTYDPSIPLPPVEEKQTGLLRRLFGKEK